MEDKTTVVIAKRKLLRTAITWIALLFAFILVQTLFAADVKFSDGQEIQAWIWFAIVSLPLLFTVLGIYIFYNPANKCVPSIFLRLTQYLYHLYFISIFGLLLFQPTIANDEGNMISLVELLETSKFGLLAFQLVVVGVTVFLLFRSKDIDESELIPEENIKPLEEIIRDHENNWFDGKTTAEKQQIQTAFASIKDTLEDHLKHDEVEEVFPILTEFLSTHGLQDNDVIALEQQFRRTKRQRSFNRISSSDAEVKFNNISAALLTLLDEIAQP